MKFFRNHDVKKETIFFILIAVLTAASGIAVQMITGGGAVNRGGFALAVAALPGMIGVLLCAAVHFLDRKRRDEGLMEMVQGIDRLLHEGKRLDIERFEEGEMSLLADELQKVTIRLEEQADRLAADKKHLADLIADISHQIRTPLTSMYLHLEAANAALGDEKKQRRHLMELRKLQDQIDWLIMSLLKLAKLDADAVIMNPAQVLLEDLVKKSAQPLAILMELKGQRLVTDAKGSALIDASWTEEALRNVLKNCVEHMEEGTLYVTTAQTPLYAQIVVRDTGEGFFREDIPHLFDRFYKGKNASSQSAGIGLALARMIIVKQNGTIRAWNHPEGGAAFEIRFYRRGTDSEEQKKERNE